MSLKLVIFQTASPFLRVKINTLNKGRWWWEVKYCRQTLTTGMLGHVSQINTKKTSTYTFRTIKASLGEIEVCSSPDICTERDVYLWNVEQVSLL